MTSPSLKDPEPQLDLDVESGEALLTVMAVVALWWILMMLCMGGLVVESLMKGMK